MAQIFPKWTNSIPAYGLAALSVGAVLVTFVVWFWFSPKHTDVGYAPQQPIPYSHALHAGATLPNTAFNPDDKEQTQPLLNAGLGMDCRYCHYNVERSAHAGVPPTQVCMNCHSQVKKDSPLLEPLRKSWAEGKDGGPVHWLRVHKLPDYVYFNHSAHVGVGVGENRAAIGCETCHGRIDTMAVVRQVQPLSMSWCIDCHNHPEHFLRPADAVTRMGWSPPLGWGDTASAIAATLTPPGRATGSYTENPGGTHTTRATAGCNGCHR